MSQYLKINEFAKLRNINVNSLRYYEKLGILTPAKTDPRTGYRYYLPEQLGLLDTIILCIHLGIPLKELDTYTDSQGNMNERKILEDGKRLLEQKIADMQIGLELTKFNLSTMEANKRYHDQTGIYERRIPERYLIVEPFCGNWNDIMQKEKTAIQLFHHAQEYALSPVFPAGILIHYGKDNISYAFYFQVLHPDKDNRQIIRLPECTYTCIQVKLTPETDILEVLDKHFTLAEETDLLISNMILDKLHFDSRHSEIQVPVLSPH